MKKKEVLWDQIRELKKKFHYRLAVSKGHNVKLEDLNDLTMFFSDQTIQKYLKARSLSRNIRSAIFRHKNN